MSNTFSIRVAGFDDEGIPFKGETLNFGDCSYAGVPADVIIITARGLLYESNWSQVEHAVYVRLEGSSWECLASFGRRGQEDPSVEERLHDTLFEDDSTVSS